MFSASVTRAVDRTVDFESEEPDHQLQCSLESACRSPDFTDRCYTARKHRWDASRSSLESDFISEVSGQFDDAEEFDSPLPDNPDIGVRTESGVNDSPSSHSVKRRRSNDWPQPPGDDDSTGRKECTSGSRQRWPFHGYGTRLGLAHGSPRSPKYGRAGRRSRFVEGNMNDTVSEKPPSIFLRDVGTNEPARRQSGIFRFGKAIASAFNPFGGWSSVSEIWRGSHDGRREEEATNDRLRQAEMAYEELKRAGYKGTAKGSCMQSLGTSNASLPDETWRSIRQNMEYGSGVGHHSRQSFGHTPSNCEPASGSSLRPSFPDLRKTRSSLGIKRPDGMSSLLQHLDSRGQEVRHQKSRKDMQRQAKLLKRVSDLEDKLERARRELQELTSEEELLVQDLHEERPYQRKFIPGALPSLPSERLLHDLEPAAPLSPLPETTDPEPGSESTRPRNQVRVDKTSLLSPRPWRKTSLSTPRSRSAHSLSRKRKSPGAESKRRNPIDEQEDQRRQPLYNLAALEDPARNQIATSAQSAPSAPALSRIAKLPKTARGDSPGSVERMQKHKSSPAAAVAESTPSPVAEERVLRSTNPRNTSATPVLKMKRGRVDLRSTTSPGPDENKENGYENEKNTLQNDENEEHIGSSELELPDSEPDQTPASPTSTSVRRKARYEYIPPVPPLPKDLAATAAKVDRRLAKEMGKRRVQRQRDGKVPADGFQWPEDFF